MPSKLWSAQQLSEETGLPMRTIIHWGASSVLHATPESFGKGHGTRRQYPEREAEICAILAPLLRFGVLVGFLRELATVLRILYSPSEQVTGAAIRNGFSAIVHARRGQDVWLWVDHYDGAILIALTERKPSRASLPFPGDDDWISSETFLKAPHASSQKYVQAPQHPVVEGEQDKFIEIGASPELLEVASAPRAFLITNLTDSISKLRR